MIRRGREQAGKVLTLREAVDEVRADQAAGHRVVMCHGCFDLVHPGHIRHLRQAAKLGDRLLVSVTGDEMINKGDGRPLIPQELRLENLAALDCVDWVTVNTHPTAVELLDQIRPDVFVKGREYEHNSDPRFLAEREVVERHGGRVVFTSGDVVFSSTALIDAIEETASPFQGWLRGLTRSHPEALDEAARTIEKFQGRRVLVIGETIIDTYVMCDRPDVAGEAPVMTLRPLESRSFDGGAAIVARHLAAMGARPTLLTALPDGGPAETLRQRLFIEGVSTHTIPSNRPIIEKRRFLVGSSKVMKLDLGEPVVLDVSDRQRFIARAVEFATEGEAVVIADFGQGLFSSATMSQLCETLRPKVACMVGDVSGRRSNLLAMRDMDLICPSELELRDGFHNYDDGLSSVAWDALSQTRSRSAMITLGDDGLVAFHQRPDAHLFPNDWRSRLDAEHVPAFTAQAVDQLGCGDALLAAASLAATAGSSIIISAVLGSVAAAAEAMRLGNAVISAADLRRGIRRLGQARIAHEPAAASTLDLFNAQLRGAHT